MNSKRTFFILLIILCPLVLLASRTVRDFLDLLKP